MSLFSKFASIFSSKPTLKNQKNSQAQLNEILKIVMCSSLKFDLKQSATVMANYLTQNDSKTLVIIENIDILFDFIATYKPAIGEASLSLIQLLAVIHQMFHCQEISQEMSIKMRDCRISKQEHEEFDNYLTEPDLIARVNKEQCYTEINISEDYQLLHFAQNYFNYLQRLASNIDLYRAVGKNIFPYVTEKDPIEPKLLFLWLYKLQNLINSAIILLKQELVLSSIQSIIYYDLWKFQKFICDEMEKVIDCYITFPNSDTLSLHEIYSESCRHYEILKKFQQSVKRSKLRDPIQCQTNNSIWQDFINFVPKLKVLNQMIFKKSLKVPNKTNPCLGVPEKNPNVMHLRASSGQYKNEHLNSDESFTEQNDKVLEMMSDGKKKQKKIHIRGQSTFQFN